MEIFKKNWLFLLLVIGLTIFLQYLPFLYHLRQTPPDRVYLGAERYTPDYYIYLFYTNQGALNRVSVSDFYTNEPHNEALVHIEYLVMGKIGALIGLGVVATFYLFRSLFLIIYLLLSFWFIAKFFKDLGWQRITFLFSIFWGGVFWPTTEQGLIFKTFFDFYQPPDLINRLTFEPHKLMGMSLFLLLLFYGLSFYENYQKYNLSQRIRRFVLLLLFALLGGLIHGITIISLIFTVVFYLLSKSLLVLFSKEKIRLLWQPALLMFLLFLVMISPIFYWQQVFSQNPVWYQVFKYWEGYFVQIDSKAPLAPTLVGFFLILGPLILLSLIGVRKLLTEHKNLGLLLISFLSSNLFLFFYGYIFLGTSKHRYYQTPYLLVWSILAIYGLRTLFSRPQRLSKLRFVMAGVACFLLLSVGLPGTKQGFEKQFYQFGQPPNLELLAYPTKGMYGGFLWLKDHSRTNDVILSLPTVGNIIPAIPGRKVLVGDYVHSYLYAEKLPLVQKFFKGEMTLGEAENFLNKEKVNFVFVSVEEKALGNLSSYVSLLQNVYQNDETMIYKIK